MNDFSPEMPPISKEEQIALDIKKFMEHLVEPFSFTSGQNDSTEQGLEPWEKEEKLAMFTGWLNGVLGEVNFAESIGNELRNGDTIIEGKPSVEYRGNDNTGWQINHGPTGLTASGKSRHEARQALEEKITKRVREWYKHPQIGQTAEGIQKKLTEQYYRNAT